MPLHVGDILRTVILHADVRELLHLSVPVLAVIAEQVRAHIAGLVQGLQLLGRPGRRVVIPEPLPERTAALVIAVETEDVLLGASRPGAEHRHVLVAGRQGEAADEPGGQFQRLFMVAHIQPDPGFQGIAGSRRGLVAVELEVVGEELPRRLDIGKDLLIGGLRRRPDHMVRDARDRCHQADAPMGGVRGESVRLTVHVAQLEERQRPDQIGLGQRVVHQLGILVPELRDEVQQVVQVHDEVVPPLPDQAHRRGFLLVGGREFVGLPPLGVRRREVQQVARHFRIHDGVMVIQAEKQVIRAQDGRFHRFDVREIGLDVALAQLLHLEEMAARDEGRQAERQDDVSNDLLHTAVLLE